VIHFWTGRACEMSQHLDSDFDHIGMELTEGLASVTAQTLPVLAFAATLEILTIHRTHGEELKFLRAFVRRHSGKSGPRLAVGIMIARWIPILVYLTLIIYDIRAELLCLRVLGGDQGLSAYGKDIENAMFWSFVAVVLMPIAPVLLRTQSLFTIKRAIGLEPSSESSTYRDDSRY
jgi:hypothetical protein